MSGSSTPRLTAVPALRSNARKVKLLQRVIFGVVFAGFACGPLALLVAAQPAPQQEAVSVPLWSKVAPSYQAFAYQVATDYLNGTGTTLAVAKDVDPGFGSNRTGQALEHDSLILRDVATTTYAASQGRGTWYQYTFSFSFRTPRAHNTDSGGSTENVVWDRLILDVVVRQAPPAKAPTAVLAAVPTLRADVWRDITPADWDQLGFFGMKADAKFDANIRRAVDQWADPFVTDNRAALADIVNAGGATKFTYPGLGGFVLTNGQNPTVLASIIAPNGETDASCKDNIGKQLFVSRVRMPLNRTGTSFTSWSDFDVLIEDGGTPAVRSWGKAGSGPTLCMYGTALEKLGK